MYHQFENRFHSFIRVSHSGMFTCIHSYLYLMRLTIKREAYQLWFSRRCLKSLMTRSLYWRRTLHKDCRKIERRLESLETVVSHIDLLLNRLLFIMGITRWSQRFSWVAGEPWSGKDVLNRWEEKNLWAWISLSHARQMCQIGNYKRDQWREIYSATRLTVATQQIFTFGNYV